MSYRFTATNDYFQSIKTVETLISFAILEKENGNSDNYILFLRLSVISIVTKFQVYIESVLEEFVYEINNSGKPNKDLSVHFRLNNFKLYFSKKNIQKELENPINFDINKLDYMKLFVNDLSSFSDENSIITNNNIKTNFPLGKTGLTELIDLFNQIEGKNIFQNASFDINKINEILGRRHAIIHEDKDMQLTDFILNEYKDFMKNVVEYIDNYLNGNV